MKVDGATRAAVESLRERYGRSAYDESMKRLEAATAARDHRAAILWADACIVLREA